MQPLPIARHARPIVYAHCAAVKALSPCTPRVRFHENGSAAIQPVRPHGPPGPRSQRRRAHTRRRVSSAAYTAKALDDASVEAPVARPLSCLPWTDLLRSYAITSVSSIPFLLRPSLSLLSYLAHTTSPVFNADRNPILHLLLKKTFYTQFCAGETPTEVRRTIAALKDTGYQGVILGHAREAVLTEDEVAGLDAEQDAAERARCDADEVRTWKENTINTIDLTQKGDFVAIKFTGAGRQALRHLKATIPCSPEFEAAVHEMCQRAQAKGVKLLFDAEQASLQQGIDNWTIYFERVYNRHTALVYGTYQAYAVRTPPVLAAHLELARTQDFVLGVKLVRGAYMGSDPRHLMWPTIEATHRCYNDLAEHLIRRQFGGVMQPVDGAPREFPRVALVLATHNAQSVRLARALRDDQARRGEAQIDVAYGQLMGMADNVSCEIVQTARDRVGADVAEGEIPRAYKYLVWGKLGECMKYLLRRAHENQDAVTRTVEARQALRRELSSRLAFWR